MIQSINKYMLKSGPIFVGEEGRILMPVTVGKVVIY